MTTERQERPDDDRLLEAAYRAEVAIAEGAAERTTRVNGVERRLDELAALAVHDLGVRVAEHPLLRRADDTARVAALRFVERRMGEARKAESYDESGLFAGFLRRVVHNLLLDWLRSPTGKAELRRGSEESLAGHEPSEEPVLLREEIEEKRRLSLHHLVAVRTIRGALPPGRGVVLRLALWPAYPHDDDDEGAIAGFAHCHETARGQADARACDAGKRCTTPTPDWRRAFLGELAEAKAAEPSGLSRKAVATLSRIGLGKPMQKREGAVCERISKGRMQLLEALRRSGITGDAS